jgi:uncharacterized membrane protein
VPDDQHPRNAAGPSGRAGPERRIEVSRLGSPDRVVALSDGVFAIILTILVLELVVPPNLSEQSLAEALEEMRPTAVAWVVSFLLTGMYWVGHRDLFAQVRVVNRDLIWLNLLFLLPAGLIPFASSVLGEYPDEAIAVHIYTAVMLAVALMRLLNYWYAARRPHLLWDPDVVSRSRLKMLIVAAPIPVYVIAAVVAGVSVTAALVLLAALPMLYFLLVTLLRERPATATEADEFS